MGCLTWTAMEVVVWVGVGGACGPITSGPICRHDQPEGSHVRPKCQLITPPRADVVHISNTLRIYDSASSRCGYPRSQSHPKASQAQRRDGSWRLHSGG